VGRRPPRCAEGGEIAALVGAEAPPFELRDQNNQVVTLASYRGSQAVLVVFYPFAFSAICTAELGAVRDSLESFQNPSVQIVAISVDHVFALKAWSKAEGYTFPLLSDFWPHGAVAQRYGVFNAAAGMALRGTFLVSTSGLVTFAEVNEPGVPRDQAGWRRALAAL
jgi:mycoredoxin-dependent peroxiredoxin